MPSIERTLLKVDSFRELAEGWRFGESGPPTEERIAIAKYWLLYARNLGLDRANAFVGQDREIQISFHADDRDLEITFEADNSITVAEDLSYRQVAFEENVGAYSLPSKLWAFRYLYPLSAGSFIRETIIQRQAASTLRPSSPKVMIEPPPLSTATVRLPRAVASVTTSEPITITLRSSLDSSANLPTSMCPTPA